MIGATSVARARLRNAAALATCLQWVFASRILTDPNPTLPLRPPRWSHDSLVSEKVRLLRFLNCQDGPSSTVSICRLGDRLRSPRRHGMPGKGYFTEIATSPNFAGRRQDAGLERWAVARSLPGFDKEASRWEYAGMIRDHQNSVREFRDWPEVL